MFFGALQNFCGVCVCVFGVGKYWRVKRESWRALRNNGGGLSGSHRGLFSWERTDKGQRKKRKKTRVPEASPGVEVSYSGLVTGKQGPLAAALVSPDCSVTSIPELDNETRGRKGRALKTKKKGSFFKPRGCGKKGRPSPPSPNAG